MSKSRKPTSKRSGPTYEKAWLFQVGRDPILVAVFSDPFRVVPASDKNFPSRGSASAVPAPASSEEELRRLLRSIGFQAAAAAAKPAAPAPLGGKRLRKRTSSRRPESYEAVIRTEPPIINWGPPGAPTLRRGRRSGSAKS